jgi:hypothetical protein
MIPSILCPKILAFIIGEVTRQGYDVETTGGAERVVYMGEAWNLARQLRNSKIYFPTYADIQQLGRMVEPAKNYNGFRTCNVGVGAWVAPSFVNVPILVRQLIEKHGVLFQGTNQATRQDADAFYVAFEKVHPFLDGNGRVGKILHNWVLGTLEEPVLVADYFGHGIP